MRSQKRTQMDVLADRTSVWMGVACRWGWPVVRMRCDVAVHTPQIFQVPSATSPSPASPTITTPIRVNGHHTTPILVNGHHTHPRQWSPHPSASTVTTTTACVDDTTYMQVVICSLLTNDSHHRPSVRINHQPTQVLPPLPVRVNGHQHHHVRTQVSINNYWAQFFTNFIFFVAVPYLHAMSLHACPTHPHARPTK